MNTQTIVKQVIETNSKKYSLIVARLQNGTATMQQVTTYFILTNQQHRELTQAAKQGKMIAEFYAGTTASKPYVSNLYRAF